MKQEKRNRGTISNFRWELSLKCHTSNLNFVRCCASQRQRLILWSAVFWHRAIWSVCTTVSGKHTSSICSTEADWCSEAMVPMYQTAWRHNNMKHSYECIQGKASSALYSTKKVTYLPTHPPTYLRLCSPLLDLGRFFSFLILYTIGRLLGRGIGPSQGRYLHTGQHKPRINVHRHPCPEWDSNPGSQRSNEQRQFLP
jgi:hypothetical protein